MFEPAFDIDLFDLASERCFRIEQVLGQSTFETTQLVFITDTAGAEHGPFVRKLVNKEIGLGSAYNELYEAQAQGLTPEQLPRIYLLSEDDKLLEVIMEYFEGKTLAEVISSCHTYSERLLLTKHYFPELCQAVETLHTSFGSPIIHRDLKPSNIMICLDGVKLLDLGIARIYKQGAESDTKHFGTRPYAPPEQYGFGQTDIRSDVYALGKVLYFCLTGEEPEADVKQKLAEHHEIDEGLVAAIIHATKLDPETRPSNVEVLLQEVEPELENACKKLEATNKSYTDRSQTKSPMSEYVPTSSADMAPIAVMAGRISPKKEPFKHLGIIWDIILLISSLTVVAGAVFATVNPIPENATRPLWYLIYSFFLWIVPCTLIVLYLMSDRRPIRKLIPKLANQSIAREVINGFLIIMGLTFAWVIITLIAH